MNSSNKHMTNMSNHLSGLFPQMLKLIGGKIMPQMCSEHHVHMIKLPNHKNLVCPVAFQNQLSQKMDRQATHLYQNSLIQPWVELRHNDRNWLKQHSFFDDAQIEDAKFSNFSTRLSKKWIANSIYTRSYKQCTKELTLLKDNAENIATMYCQNNPNVYFNTILAGGPGRGKSHLAMSILHYVNTYVDPFKYNPKTKHYPRCMFVNTVDLLTKIENSFGHGDITQHIIDVLSHVYLLVLDDFGSENIIRPSDSYHKDDSLHDDSSGLTYTQRILYGILNHRKRTIFTTNASITKLAKGYNNKIISRMIDNSHDHILKFPNWIPDFRRDHVEI